MIEKATENFIYHDLGLIDYGQSLVLQKKSVEQIIAGGPSTVLFCEHPTVLTLGRLGTNDNILYPLDELKKHRVHVVRIDRGGEVTLHAPGQLVIYPIINLNNFGRDLKIYLYKLEQAAIDLLQDFDILAERIEGQRGIWVKENKLVSIGIGVRKWVAYHGLGINVNTDLKLFSMIKPCGVDVQMTSMQKILGHKVDMDKVKTVFKKHFEGFPLLAGEPRHFLQKGNEEK